MKSVIFVALFTLFLMEVSIVPVHLVPIFGGTKVNSISDYPYMCGITKILYNEENNFPCGCAILSPNYAITAASCVYGGDPASPFTFFAGTVASTIYTKEGQQREIFKDRDVVIHPDFDINNTETLTKTNLAIIKLSPALNFDENVKRIYLAEPLDCEYRPGNKYAITGWGSNKTYDSNSYKALRFGGVSIFDRIFSENLLWGEANPKRRSDCEAVFKKGYDHEKNICSNNPTGVCIGDTGGPYAVSTSNRFVYLCGIIGVGQFDCNLKNSIYMRPSYYKEWICENTKNETGGCDRLHLIKLLTSYNSTTPTKVIIDGTNTENNRTVIPTVTLVSKFNN